jgi:alpha-beta hydrolase superfamily lysophospholipase
MAGGFDPSQLGPMLAMMGNGIWEMPMVQNIAFHPRPATAEYTDGSGKIRDGTFTMADDSKVAYRLFLPEKKAEVVVYYWHANAEICTDITDQAKVFLDAGAALLSIGHRGFAWGTGQPSLSKLCPDAEASVAESETLLAGAGLSGYKRVAMARSIGATCAVHVAAHCAADFHGLIVESGLMSIKEMPMVQMMATQMLGPQAPQIFGAIQEPNDTYSKMAIVACPTLVLHGKMDDMIPLAQAEGGFDKCPAVQKRKKVWERAGHNDVQMHAGAEWATLVASLLAEALEFTNEFPTGALVEAHSLSKAEFNGLQGKVVGPQPGGERIRVKFDDGEKALKGANLKVLDRKPPPPPPVEAKGKGKGDGYGSKATI